MVNEEYHKLVYRIANYGHVMSIAEIKICSFSFLLIHVGKCVSLLTYMLYNYTLIMFTGEPLEPGLKRELRVMGTDP